MVHTSIEDNLFVYFNVSTYGEKKNKLIGLKCNAKIIFLLILIIYVLYIRIIILVHLRVQSEVI